MRGLTVIQAGKGSTGQPPAAACPAGRVLLRLRRRPGACAGPGNRTPPRSTQSTGGGSAMLRLRTLASGKGLHRRRLSGCRFPPARDAIPGIPAFLPVLCLQLRASKAASRPAVRGLTRIVAAARPAPAPGPGCRTSRARFHPPTPDSGSPVRSGGQRRPSDPGGGTAIPRRFPTSLPVRLGIPPRGMRGRRGPTLSGRQVWSGADNPIPRCDLGLNRVSPDCGRSVVGRFHCA